MLCFAAAIFAVPIAANAQRAWALNGAEIFAGPGNDYPIVARLAPGVAVRVQGCLNDYSWCDVTFGGNRGWVYAGELGYAYENRRVPILDYGPRIGLPVITFSIGNYWDHYYRGRPWYRERDRWEHRAWNGEEHRRYENNGRERRNESRYENERRNESRQDNNRRGEQRNDYRGNTQPFSNNQSEQFRRDRQAGRDTTRDNAPRAGTLPPGSSPPPTTPGYYGSQQ